jgi:acyl transferase domain-containing protein
MASTVIPRALLVTPGRGTYSVEDLWPERRLAAADAAGGPEAAGARAFREAVASLDTARTLRGARPLEDVVRASGARQGHELPPDVVSALIFAAGAADAGALAAAEEAGALRAVAVVGLSLGWYTALHLAGALPLADAARVVDFTGAWQAARDQVGGQLVHPVVADEDWRRDPAREASLERALEDVAAGLAGRAWRSIRLGGYEVLAGDEAGLAALAAALPREERKGGIAYPMRLPGHSAFHTPLMAPMSEAAQEPLTELDWRAPRVPLVDGRGAIWRPRIASPDALLDYTAGAQVVETYDFALSLRVALREHAPDVVIALGPGDTLGGPIGQTLVREGWEGIRDREAFRRRQAGPRPILLSMGRSADRERVLARAAAPA